MNIAALLTITGDQPVADTIASLAVLPVTAIAQSVPMGNDAQSTDCLPIAVAQEWSKQALITYLQWFLKTDARHLLIVTGPGVPVFNANGIQRMISCIESTGASLVYGDWFEATGDGAVELRQCIDYQQGSIRDTFNFGPALLVNGTFIPSILDELTSDDCDYTYGGRYDLRLRLSEKAPVRRLPEPLYHCISETAGDRHAAHFAYVDPRNRAYQVEMEQTATTHLRRIGAFITPPEKQPLDDSGSFPVEASVIIPVRNRQKTIADAVDSALSQQTDFPFNVIVVDNHSTDDTTKILAAKATTDTRLVHYIPQRTDLLIGGCWNEAVYSPQCGRYAVQLDSDDIYDGTGVVQQIIDAFRKERCALVIGSYTTVNFDLKLLPPGLIDHREWTDNNGMNNALRIAGLGAPRAYHVPTLRRFGFPNVSYGEDYAAVLRLSRSYPVGRIYESLYWCRRWDENSDSRLSPETANRYDHYKDALRSVEIAARIRKVECR